MKAFMKNIDLSFWTFQVPQAEVEGAQVWTRGLEVLMGPNRVSEIVLKVWVKCVIIIYLTFFFFSMQILSFVVEGTNQPLLSV